MRYAVYRTLAAMLGWTTENTIAVLAVLVASIGIVAPLVVSGRRKRADAVIRAAEQKFTARAAAEAALEAASPAFAASLRPIAQDVQRAGDPPIELAVRDDAVWVHAVALNWRYSTETEWHAPEEPCSPSHGVVLPAQLSSPRAMHFEWPGDRPPRVAQLQWELHVTWGLASSGPVRTSVIPTSSTNWQYS